MSERSLTDVINELRSERTACEKILSEMQALKDGEFQEVFALTLKLCRQTSSEITDLLKETASTSVSASADVSSDLKESISLLKDQETRFKRIQHRCTAFTVVSWTLLLSCFMFMGWTGSLYWLTKYETSSLWFRKIVVDNADLIDKCLDPEILKHSEGKCTIQLPVQPVQQRPLEYCDRSYELGCIAILDSLWEQGKTGKLEKSL